MRASNSTIADLLRQYASILSLQGADRFKLKAYRRAAETIEGLNDQAATLIKRGSDLTELPGIGNAISQVILEIVRTGKLARLERTIADLPAEQVELAARPALDPSKVARIYKKLGIGSLIELQRELESGRIREVFGERLEYHVRQGLDDRPRHLLWSMKGVAAMIERFLRSMPGVAQVATAGSIRRKRETVGDLDFLVAGNNPTAIFKRFRQFGAVRSSTSIGPAECLFKLSSGTTVSLHWTAPEEWGLSLILATGSSAHLDDLAAKAKARKCSLTASSLRSKGIELGQEATVYQGLGLSFVEPELREGRGEVAAGAKGKLPRLVTIDDIRGDLHMHTTASDGANSIAQMAAAAQERGYEYIAITDHSQSLKITNGLSEKRLLAHIRAIDKVNAKLSGLRILKSAEVDILEDGRLDYSDGVLAQLDFTVCSIHSRFALNKEQQTQRILRAMDNPYFNILGHATGRLLLKRPGYEIDIERIIKHAKARGCLFEINSSPDRLDLSAEHAQLAKDAGIPIAVNTDAHSIGELDFMSAGINQARRAWLEPSDVLNARPLKAAIRLLRR